MGVRRTRRIRATAWLVALGALMSACHGPIASLYPPHGGDRAYPVWVVRHRWHTGLVVRREDVPADIWPERDDFPGAEYLEVGWGERDFYQARRGLQRASDRILRRARGCRDHSLDARISAVREPPD